MTGEQKPAAPAPVAGEIVAKIARIVDEQPERYRGPLNSVSIVRLDDLKYGDLTKTLAALQQEGE